MSVKSDTKQVEKVEEDKKNKLLLFTDVNLVEGIIGSVTYPFFAYYLKIKYDKISLLSLVSFTWLFTWLCRRIFTNMYVYLKNLKDEKAFDYTLPVSNSVKDFLLYFI